MNILEFRNESLRILTAGKEPSEAFMSRFCRFMDFWMQHCELLPVPTFSWTQPLPVLPGECTQKVIPVETLPKVTGTMTITPSPPCITDQYVEVVAGRVIGNTMAKKIDPSLDEIEIRTGDPHIVSYRDKKVDSLILKEAILKLLLDIGVITEYETAVEVLKAYPQGDQRDLMIKILEEEEHGNRL